MKARQGTTFFILAACVILAVTFAATREHWWLRAFKGGVTVNGAKFSEARIYRSPDGSLLVNGVADCLVIQRPAVLMPNCAKIRALELVAFLESVPVDGVDIRSPKVESVRDVKLEQSSLSFEYEGKNIQIAW